MKKFKILFATVMLGIATVGGFQAYDTMTMTDAEKLMLQNVEALTRSEGPMRDNKSEKEKCDNGKTRVYCVSRNNRTCYPQDC